MSVAEFIDASLQDDGVSFEEGPRKRAYDLYFKYFDEGLSQDEILRKMTQGDDLEVTNLVVGLTSTRYELTEKHLKGSLTNPQTILIQNVPKAILLYHARRMDKQLEEYRAKVKEPGADKMAILTEIAHLNDMRHKINNKIGRI